MSGIHSVVSLFQYFVVVKKEKGTLSVEQTLWFRYLISVGANVGIVRISCKILLEIII